jgi:hypothetical protein
MTKTRRRKKQIVSNKRVADLLVSTFRCRTSLRRYAVWLKPSSCMHRRTATSSPSKSSRTCLTWGCLDQRDDLRRLADVRERSLDLVAFFFEQLDPRHDRLEVDALRNGVDGPQDANSQSPVIDRRCAIGRCHFERFSCQNRMKVSSRSSAGRR